MMSFMSKKKKYKFHVNLELEELSSVPFLSGVLFAKIRLHDGGNFLDHSSREEVQNNCVRWNSKFSFPCKMLANATTGVLDHCICRVSVRREVRGGRSHQKLGFADINLAEFAGSGQQSKRFLLEGYDAKHRQDNSTLKVTIEMALLVGDPVFKVPYHQSLKLPGEISEAPADVRLVDECSEGSLASVSSGFGSLPRKDKPSAAPAPISESFDPDLLKEKEFEKSHSRNSSYASQQSRGSGYGSLTHSRQSSVGNDGTYSHARTPSTGSSLGDFNKLERRRKLEESGKDRRVEETRVNAEDLVNELIQETDLGQSESEESSGLQLLVGKDGTMALG